LNLDALTPNPLAITSKAETSSSLSVALPTNKDQDNSVKALLPSRANLLIKPKWHAPWKLYRVISGHTGWVRAVDVEPNNEWFATGGADRIIKVSFFPLFLPTRIQIFCHLSNNYLQFI
jgi:pleiotropic regulator 1